MKKSTKAMMMSLGMAAVVGAFAPNANAQVVWTISPDGNAIAGGVTVVNGVVEFGGVDMSQPVGIFGAGFTYTGGSSFSMNFDSDLNTWDSYNALGTNLGGNGYYDAFIVTVNTTGFYWSTSHTDPVTASASTFVWGGSDYADGILESYVTAPIPAGDTISLAAGSATYYVSLVLDTKSAPQSDTLHSSYGSFHVSPIPEPETYAMLLAGLGLMGFVARRRQRKLAVA